MKVLILLLVLFSASAFGARSSEERANLNYELGLDIGLDYKMATTQLTFGKFIDAESIVLVKVGQGSEDEDTQFNASVQYKYFASNTFYIAPEIYYINYKENGDNWFDDDGDALTGIGAQFRIGNQWQWKHFSIGTDWVGVGKTVAFFNRGNNSHKESPYTFTLANFYMTWSF